MNNFWVSLNRREKAMVVATAAVVLGLVSYFAIIHPLAKQLQYYQGRIPAQRELLTWMEQSSRQVQKMRALRQNTTKYSGKESAPDFISKTATGRGFGDRIKRVEPTGEGIKVVIEDVIFDDIISWIALLQEHYGLTVADISIERAKEPGFVNVQILFKEGSHGKS